MKWVKFIFTVSYLAISVSKYMAVYCLMLYLLTFLPIFSPFWFYTEKAGGGGGGGGGQPHGDQK